MGNKATDVGVPDVNIGILGLSKKELRITCVTVEIEAETQENIEEVIIIEEAQSKELSMDMFELIEGGNTMSKKTLDICVNLHNSHLPSLVISVFK